MSGYEGTRWLRKRDDAEIRIEADAESAGGRGNRSLRALNLVSRRSFWVTPEWLHRKYERIFEHEQRPEEEKP